MLKKDGEDMEAKTDRRIKITKRLLQDAFTEMLKEKDIYHISIRELCERADVNRTTFYKYYGNQFDLLDEMENDLLHSIEETFNKENVDEASGIEKILLFLEKDIDFTRLLLNSRVDIEFPQKLFSLATVTRTVEKTMLNIPLYEREYIHRFLLYGAYEMIRAWVNKDNRESAGEMALIILKRFTLNIK